MKAARLFSERGVSARRCIPERSERGGHAGTALVHLNTRDLTAALQTAFLSASREPRSVLAEHAGRRAAWAAEYFTAAEPEPLVPADQLRQALAHGTVPDERGAVVFPCASDL